MLSGAVGGDYVVFCGLWAVLGKGNRMGLLAGCGRRGFCFAEMSGLGKLRWDARFGCEAWLDWDYRVKVLAGHVGDDVKDDEIS